MFDKLKNKAKSFAPSTCRIGANVVTVTVAGVERGAEIAVVVGVGVPLVWAEPITGRFDRYVDVKLLQLEEAAARIEADNETKYVALLGK